MFDLIFNWITEWIVIYSQLMLRTLRWAFKPSTLNSTTAHCLQLHQLHSEMSLSVSKVLYQSFFEPNYAWIHQFGYKLVCVEGLLVAGKQYKNFYHKQKVGTRSRFGSNSIEIACSSGSYWRLKMLVQRQVLFFLFSPNKILNRQYLSWVYVWW